MLGDQSGQNEAIPEFFPGEPVRENLLAISARSLDRLMTPVRRKHGTRGRCGTRPGSLLKNLIPIKTEHADIHKPGVMDVNTVAHSGQRLDGNFAWSLTLTDIFSGWTVNRVVWNKGYDGVRRAIENIEASLPFRITGFHLRRYIDRQQDKILSQLR